MATIRSPVKKKKTRASPTPSQPSAPETAPATIPDHYLALLHSDSDEALYETDFYDSDYERCIAELPPTTYRTHPDQADNKKKNKQKKTKTTSPLTSAPTLTPEPTTVPLAVYLEQMAKRPAPAKVHEPAPPAAPEIRKQPKPTTDKYDAETKPNPIIKMVVAINDMLDQIREQITGKSAGNLKREVRDQVFNYTTDINSLVHKMARQYVVDTTEKPDTRNQTPTITTTTIATATQTDETPNTTQAATQILGTDFTPPSAPNQTPTFPITSSNLKEDILTCVREEINKLREEIKPLRKLPLLPNPTTAPLSTPNITAPLSYARAAASSTLYKPPTPQPAPVIPKSKPALILAPPNKNATRQEVLETLRRSGDFKNTSYAPSKVKPLSNAVLRVEFDKVEDRDDALKRISTACTSSEYRAEPAKQRNPLVILKGITNETPSEELSEIILRQNPELGTHSTGDLKLAFKKNNRRTSMYNAVFNVKPSLWRAIISLGRVRVDMQRVHAEEYSRFTQCFRCLQFGHLRNKCNQAPACSICTGLHETETCQEDKTKPKCLNCKTRNEKFQSSIDIHHSPSSNSCPTVQLMRLKVHNSIDYGQ